MPSIPKSFCENTVFEGYIVTTTIVTNRDTGNKTIFFKKITHKPDNRHFECKCATKVIQTARHN